jgi:prepilin-type N-terminal cleavage/methylation domain-containing protein
LLSSYKYIITIEFNSPEHTLAKWVFSDSEPARPYIRYSRHKVKSVRPLNRGRQSVDLIDMRNHAFTLVEMMIVVACLAIAAVLVAPMATDASQTRLIHAAQLVMSDLAYAQAQTLRQSDDPYAVVFDTANNRYYIALQSDTDTPITHPTDKTPYQTQFGIGRAAGLSGVVLQSVDLDGDAMVVFGRYGQIDQVADATITLAEGSHTLTITVDAITGATSVP